MRNRLMSLVLATILTISQSSAVLADQSFWGGAVGAGLGGLVGSQFGKGSGQLVTTGLGVATGALIGSNIGASMDRSSRTYYGSSYGTSYGVPGGYYAPAYQPTYVAPPEPQVHVIYVQQPVYVTGGYAGASESGISEQPTQNVNCREYTQTTTIAGRTKKTRGMACQQPDGSWQIQ